MFAAAGQCTPRCEPDPGSAAGRQLQLEPREQLEDRLLEREESEVRVFRPQGFTVCCAAILICSLATNHS